MCKMIIFTKAPHPDDADKQRALFDKLLRELSKTQGDGLGIAFVDGEGTIRRRRWATSEDYKGLMEDDCRECFCEDTSSPVVEQTATGFVLLHGRTATSDKGLINAHPHMSMDASGTEYALIHNGVVDASAADKAALGDLTSGCDSELILAAFIAGGMNEVSRMITGYYAFSVIVNNEDGTRYLSVVRDNRAQLYVGSGEEDEGMYVFATTPDLVMMAGCKKSAKVLPLVHLVFDKDGDLIEMNDIAVPRAYSFDYSGYKPTASYPATSPSTAPATPSAPRPIHPLGSKAGMSPSDLTLWEAYKRENNLDDQGTPLPGAKPLLQSELPLGAEGIDDSLKELIAKREKALERAKRLLLLISRRMQDAGRNSPTQKAALAELERAAQQEDPAAQDAVGPDTTAGVSHTHGVPISDDEAQAAAAAMIEAEREAAGLTSHAI